MQNPVKKSEAIKSKAKSLGLSDCAILHVKVLKTEKVHFQKWSANDFHGEMKYKERNAEKRLNPALLLENAKTIIVVLRN